MDIGSQEATSQQSEEASQERKVSPCSLWETLPSFPLLGAQERSMEQAADQIAIWRELDCGEKGFCLWEQ